MLDRLYILVELLVITMCISKLYGKRYELDYKTVVLFMIDMIVMEGINEGYLPPASSLIVYLFIIIYCCIKYKQGIKSAIINTILAVIIAVLLQILSAIVVGNLLIGIVREKVILLVMNIVMLILLALVNRFVPLKKLSYYLQRRDITLYIILFGGTCGIIYSIYLAKLYEGAILRQYLFGYLIIVIICAMAASWESYKIKAFEKEEELNTYKLYEESYKKLITDIRVRQHDFKNHINAIYMQHSVCDTYEELVERQRKYCDEILYENRSDTLLKIDDSMLVGFLYGIFTDAEKRGINVEYSIKSGELNVDMPRVKIVSIFGNLIDNAIEALEKSNENQLYVGITEEKDCYNIEVRNVNEYIDWECAKHFFKKGYSTKGNDRGLGLYNIKRLSQEYGFEIIFSNKNIKGQNWVCFELKIDKRLS